MSEPKPILLSRGEAGTLAGLVMGYLEQLEKHFKTFPEHNRNIRASVTFGRIVKNKALLNKLLEVIE